MNEGTIVHTPRRHECDGLSGQRVRLHNGALSQWWYPDGLLPSRRHEVGTVRRCSCGRTWIAGDLDGLMASIWRPERRLARWWRELRKR